MQSLDYTTLMAVCAELRRDCLPSRVEQVYQRDRFTISLGLRTLKTRPWLTISWHPEAARIHLGSPPPKVKDTFTLSDRLRHQLNGLALIGIAQIAPWERVVDLQFAQRPGENPLWHLYVEIMGKYSNVILTDAEGKIISPARQINSTQSSLRTIQTGQLYEIPPCLTGTLPKLEETYDRWQARVSLVPGKLLRQLLNCYRGLSPQVAREIIEAAGLFPEQFTEEMTEWDWQQLFTYWQQWLKSLQELQFNPGYSEQGYTVLGWNVTQKEKNVQTLLDRYYSEQLDRQQFQQLHHQLIQKIDNPLQKLDRKAEIFRQRLQQSDAADIYRQQADLLMAHLHQWQAGMKSITLADFETEKPVTIELNPEHNAVVNAQFFYKQHQKLKRAKNSVIPLLEAVDAEINYLRQVKATLTQLDNRDAEDLSALTEIREELIQQGYLTDKFKTERASKETDSQPHRYQTPSGFELWIGRNNRQNDLLTFRTAVDYDLWFHTQEIPGSHVLLRLLPGAVADAVDLQFAADFAAYYSQARESDSVPVVYTKPKNVYKPKGTKPGMAIYKHETIVWGRPQVAKANLTSVLFKP
jgi:predicted ribosome quality control (RQC) complex YloA/Tae2 family protein